MGTARALVAGSGTCLHRIVTTSASSDAWRMGENGGEVPSVKLQSLEMSTLGSHCSERVSLGWLVD